MRTLLWTMTVALTLSGSASAALAQEEGDEDLPEASEGAPAAKPPLEQQRDDEGTDLGATSEPPKEEAPAEPTESGTAKPVSVGLLLGYGLNLGSGKNPWGLGFGIRGGYNIDQVYVGARFTYYLGSTQKETVAGVGSSETGLKIWEFGVEVGYDLKASETFTIRPELGLGAANLTVSFNAPAALISNTSSSKAFFYVAPGLSGLLDVSESVFLGVDVRIMVITSTGNATGKSTLNGLTLLANGGMRF
jgi:hypothetical protein